MYTIVDYYIFEYKHKMWLWPKKMQFYWVRHLVPQQRKYYNTCIRDPQSGNQGHSCRATSKQPLFVLFSSSFYVRRRDYGWRCSCERFWAAAPQREYRRRLPRAGHLDGNLQATPPSPQEEGLGRLLEPHLLLVDLSPSRFPTRYAARLLEAVYS